MFVHGIDIEEAHTDRRNWSTVQLLRLHRKMIIKINNLRLKRSKRRHPGGLLKDLARMALLVVLGPASRSPE